MSYSICRNEFYLFWLRINRNILLVKTVIAGKNQCFQTFKLARFALFKRIYLFKNVVALAEQYCRSCNTFGYYNGL